MDKTKYNYTFYDLKEIYDNYCLSNDGIFVLDKEKGIIITNQIMIDKIMFSISWVNCVSTSQIINNEELKYKLAFNEKSKLSYEQIMNIMSMQLKTTGNIDPIEIIDILYHKYKNIHAIEIVVELFNNKTTIYYIDKWVRYAINNPLPSTQPLLTIKEINNSTIKVM